MCLTGRQCLLQHSPSRAVCTVDDDDGDDVDEDDDDDGDGDDADCAGLRWLWL